MSIWEKHVRSQNTMHTVKKGSNYLTQDQTQTEHIYQLMKGIFVDKNSAEDHLMVSALKDQCQYLLAIGHQRDVNIKEIRIFSYKLKDQNIAPKYDHELWLNKFRTDDCKSNALLSMKISNMIIKPDKDSTQGEYLIDVNGEPYSIDSKAVMAIAGVNDISNPKKLWKREDYDAIEGIPANLIKEPQVVTILENTSDVELLLVGTGENGHARRDWTIYGIKDNKALPGIRVPITEFDNQDQYASMCQSSIQIEVNAQMDGKEHKYWFTRYTVALSPRDNSLEVILLEFYLKKFENKDKNGEVKGLIEIQKDEKDEQYVYRVDLIGKKVILLPQFVKRKYPAVYPLFHTVPEQKRLDYKSKLKGLGDNPCITIQGVRLQIGNEGDYDSRTIILRDDFLQEKDLI